MLKVAGGGGGAGGLVYKGTWDASSNTPTLTSGVGSNGDYYVVSVAGNTNLDGITDWQVNDWAIFNGTAWQKIDNTDLVTSVNGQTGNVTITLSGLGAGTIATQNANNVTITGGTIDNTVIGNTTAAIGKFTNVATPIVGNGTNGDLTIQSATTTLDLNYATPYIVTPLTTNYNSSNVQYAPGQWFVPFPANSGVKAGWTITEQSNSSVVVLVNTNVTMTVGASIVTGDQIVYGDISLAAWGSNTFTVTPVVPDVLKVKINGVSTGNIASNGELTINQIIQSTSGGFKFPDGTVQTTAANVATLGTMALQNANAVVITGGSVGNVSLSNATVDGAAPYLNFANGAGTTVAAGRQWYDGSTGSWNLGMGGGNITQQVGEELFIYGKASATITEGQLIVKTGTVGASGVITFGPSPTGLTTNDGIIGVATENITSGNFGRITSFGVVHGITTTGASVGETWADNDTLYYNPNYAGGMTNVKPTAPNIKFEVAVVINAGNGGSGSLQVLLNPGSALGGTDQNVQLSASPANNSFLVYDSALQYWKDVTSANATIALGLGTMATQNANNVAITGGSINAANIAADNGIMLNSNTVSQNVTIPTGYNGLTGGPIAVANGITVTVSSNSVWTVV